MRLALTVVSPGAQRTADVVLEADPATPVGHIAAEIGRFLGEDWTGQAHYRARVLGFAGPGAAGSLAVASSDPGTPVAAPVYVANQRVPPELTLAESPIRDGAVLSLGTPDGCIEPEPGGLVEVRVVSGPGAGSIYWLPAGQADIGSGEAADVRVWDPAIPPLALRLLTDDYGGCRVAAFAGVRAALDREPLAGPVPWQPGQLVSVGHSLLDLADYEPPDAALHPSADGAGCGSAAAPIRITWCSGSGQPTCRQAWS